MCVCVWVGGGGGDLKKTEEDQNDRGVSKLVFYAQSTAPVNDRGILLLFLFFVF